MERAGRKMQLYSSMSACPSAHPQQSMPLRAWGELAEGVLWCWKDSSGCLQKNSHNHCLSMGLFTSLHRDQALCHLLKGSCRVQVEIHCSKSGFCNLQATKRSILVCVNLIQHWRISVMELFQVAPLLAALPHLSLPLLQWSWESDKQILGAETSGPQR